MYSPRIVDLVACEIFRHSYAPELRCTQQTVAEGPVEALRVLEFERQGMVPEACVARDHLGKPGEAWI